MNDNMACKCTQIEKENENIHTETLQKSKIFDMIPIDINLLIRNPMLMNASRFTKRLRKTVISFFVFALVLAQMNVPFINVAHAAAGDIIVGYTADNVIPAAQISQATDGTGVLTITFRLKDPDTVASTLLTFEYSVNGGVAFNAPTNGDNSDSLYKTAAAADDWDTNGGTGTFSSAVDFTGTQHTFFFNTKHADLTGLNSAAQSDVQIQFKANDGAAGGFGISESFSVDNLNPATLAASNIGTRPSAGATTVSITGTFTETNPNTNQYYVQTNDGGYGAATNGTTNTATPGATNVTLAAAVDGDDCVTDVKITHTDDLGNAANNENTSPDNKCVTPYTPATTTADAISPNSIRVFVNQHASETGAVTYAIRSSGTSQYVQANGSLGASAVWQTYANWGGATGVLVQGLSSGSNYTFDVKSRNPNDTTVESSFGTSVTKATISDRSGGTRGGVNNNTTPTTTTTPTETTTTTDTTSNNTTTNTTTETTTNNTTTTETTTQPAPTADATPAPVVVTPDTSAEKTMDMLVKSRNERSFLWLAAPEMSVKIDDQTMNVASERMVVDVLSEKFVPQLSAPLAKLVDRASVVILQGTDSANPRSKQGGAKDRGTIAPTQLRMKYDPKSLSKVDLSKIAVFYYDPSTKQWSIIENAWHDGVNDRFVLDITQLGVYTLGIKQ